MLEQINNQIGYQFASCVGYKTRRQLCNQLFDQVGPQFYIRLRDQLHSQLNNQLNGQSHNQLREEIIAFQDQPLFLR